MRLISAFFLLILFLGVIPQPALADATVGDGTPGSCTRAALQTAINGGGLITFNCGPNPHTITLDQTLSLDMQFTSGSLTVTIDGGGLITLSGANARRHFNLRSWGPRAPSLTLRNITLANGRAAGNTTAANGSSIQALDQGFNPSLTATDAVVIAENVTFQNNIANLTCGSGCANEYDYGGAIYSLLSRVEVRDSTFSGNEAQNAGGGAIHILQSTLLVENTTFSNNTAIGGGQGGTIYIDGVSGSAGFATIRDSSFSGSRTHNAGGAIYVNLYENSTALTIERSSFVDNAVVGGDRATGGAIAGGSTNIGGSTGNARITITESLFSNNRVDRPGTADGSGGALGFDQRAIVTIANSTFTGNRAEGISFNANGGALYMVNHTTAFQVINSTFADNFAGWVGGAITASNGVLTNVVFSNNTAANGGNPWNIQETCSTTLNSGGGNLQFPGLTAPNDPNDRLCASGITISDPLLGPLADNAGPTQTRALLAGSPAIDAGGNTACAASPVSNRDQRGFSRPVDGDGLNGAACDSGAFEFVPNQPPGTPTLLTPANGANLTATTVTFAWNPAAFATSYRLEVDNDSDFSSLIWNQVQSGTSFTPNFIGGGLFYWRVTAINSNGDAISQARSFTLNSATTEAPIRNRVGSNPTLTWLGVQDGSVTGYQVQIARDSAFTQLVAISPDSVNAATFELSPNLIPGVYYWRVRALRGAVAGAWSSAETIAVGVGN
ncbi:MAG TPA: choice-of-anchor Q domain-containing protein [Aggregatilineales bacterium]|nr:choice-of-anchor Q domain-containing protein [Aggregatilineales bacterium]